VTYCVSKSLKFCGNHKLIVDESKFSEKFTLAHFLLSCFNFGYLRDFPNQLAFQSMKM